MIAWADGQILLDAEIFLRSLNIYIPVADDRVESMILSPNIRSPLFTAPKTKPSLTTDTLLHPSMAALVHPGIGIESTLSLDAND